MRKRWVVPTPTENDDEQMLVALRPRTLDEYIGQREVVTRLRIAIEAAKQRDESFEHLLLYSLSGFGKMTLLTLSQPKWAPVSWQQLSHPLSRVVMS